MSVVLLSGGLDSAVCLALDPDPIGVFVDYGQPHHASESAAARRIGRDIEMVWLAVSLPALARPGDPAMLVPGRNIILLSLAAAVAHTRGIDTVTIGANADDYANYPDCRPGFFAAAAPVLGVEVNAPLIELTKPQVGELARRLGVAIDETWSCYYPQGEGPCDACDACASRRRALA